MLIYRISQESKTMLELFEFNLVLYVLVKNSNVATYPELSCVLLKYTTRRLRGG